MQVLAQCSAYVPDIVLYNRRRKHDAELGTSMQIQRNLPVLQFSQRRLVTQTDSHIVFSNSQILIVCHLLSRMNPGYSLQRPMPYMLRCHISGS